MQFISTPVEEHDEVPLADDGRWENAVQQWQERERENSPKDGIQRSYVVSVVLGQSAFAPSRQAEILGLVRAQGDTVVGEELVRVAHPDARALFRRGVAEQIAERANACCANLLVIDAELTPSQTRNLEDATGLSVREREAVVLNVFQKHVRTRKARIQVEIAHLQYLRPRIRGMGLQMDQQAGGVIGSRGPGETASELLARQLDGRLAILRRAFTKVAKEGEVQRKRRLNCKTIALIGYTNAGKTSLMNSLTDAGLSAANKPFETLDTTSRCLTRHGGDVLLSDTVGFIRDLPERLFASFESTLAEISESSLLALVVDVSDPEAKLHLQTTEEMLSRLGVDGLPRVYLFNKSDRCRSLPSPLALRLLSKGHPYLLVSSRQKASVVALRQSLLAAVRSDEEECEIFVPYAATQAASLLYAKVRVLESVSTEGGTRFVVQAKSHWLGEIQKELRFHQGRQ